MQKNIIVFISLAVLFFGVVDCRAETAKTTASACKPDTAGVTCTLPNPLKTSKTENNDPSVLIGTIIKGALGVVGALTLLMMVWGGFLWFTSAGNPERVKKGTQTMMWAAIGVILVFTSYVLVKTLLKYLTTG